ncbi:hypothetical protein X975_18714, partial [Stegodyphus mimosarum]
VSQFPSLKLKYLINKRGFLNLNNKAENQLRKIYTCPQCQ